MVGIDEMVVVGVAYDCEFLSLSNDECDEYVDMLTTVYEKVDCTHVDDFDNVYNLGQLDDQAVQLMMINTVQLVQNTQAIRSKTASSTLRVRESYACVSQATRSITAS